MIHHLNGESQFSEESEEEEQTPMIIAEDEREDSTSKLPNEELLGEKNIEREGSTQKDFKKKK